MRQREREMGKLRRKRDESVDKVKLEMGPTDGGAKNVTCQVACGTPGKDGQINSYSRGDKKGGRVRMTDAWRG